MRSRPVIALVTAVAVVGAMLLSAAPASAATTSFPNPQATPDTTDFDISSVDVSYNATTVTVTAHLQNLVEPAFHGVLYILDGPFSDTVGKAVIVQNTDTGVNAQTTPAGFNGTQPADGSGVAISSSVADQTVTFAVPSSRIFWTGAIYVVVGATDTSGDPTAQAHGGSIDGQGIGLGPVFLVLDVPTIVATPTTTTVSLTSTTQVYGGVGATALATVAPARAGTLSLVEGATVLASAAATDGAAALPLPAKLATGRHDLAVTFTPADPKAAAPSTSAAFAVTVISSAKASKTTAKLSKKTQIFKKSAAKLAITVSSKATGSVAIYDGKKRLKTLTLKNGKTSYTFSKKLKKGTHKIRAVFTPTDKEVFKASTSKTLVLKVKK